MVVEPDSGPAVHVERVVKRFGATTALAGVDLEVTEGTVFALLGPNGAGKTTLIGIVCGIVNAPAGTVTVDGHDIVRDYRRRTVPRSPPPDRFGS